MIDPEARIELMRSAGAEDPTWPWSSSTSSSATAPTPTPPGELAPVCADIMAGGSGPQVVAYVLGTDGDPQGLDRQRAALVEAGCIVTATAARASLAAAAIALRRPDVVDDALS